MKSKWFVVIDKQLGHVFISHGRPEPESREEILSGHQSEGAAQLAAKRWLKRNRQLQGGRCFICGREATHTNLQGVELCDVC